MDKYIVYYGFPGSPKYIYGAVGSESQANGILTILRVALPAIERAGIIPVKS